MSIESYSRLASSLSIDELLNQPDSRPPQNWLLTYIDVFVLIVMLVVTLVALSKFESTQTTTQKRAKPQIVKKISKPKPVQPVIQTEIASTKTNTAEIKNNSKLPASPAGKVNSTETQEIQEKQEKQTIVIENTNNLEQEVLQVAVEEKQVQTEEIDIQQQLNKQLEELGLKGSINMKVTQGYAQLEIQDNILYKSSEAKLTDSGQSLLKQLTALLQQSAGLIYIEGHTDNRPIKTTQFPTNWELGAARATSVLHFLSTQQIEASRMRAVTYADTKPIADNKTEQGRQKNRRVNIVIKVSDKID